MDSAGRILRDRRHNGSPTAYTQRLFGYDDLGELTGSKDVSSIPWNCGGSGSFDPNYGYVGCPMDTVTAPSYETYDDAGNPNASWITRGTADQLATAGMSNMTYDADGNVVTHTFGGSGIAERDYSWSAENRLTVGRMQGDSVRLEYDPLGQPVVRRGRAGQGVRVTLYDGGSILADLDSAGNRIAEYIYDEGADRPYAMLTGSTTVTGAQYFVVDDMGNVQGTLKDSATVAQTVTYDDLGTPAVLGDTTNRLTWKGLSYDRDLMLTYMRARWYDPMVGRFVSEDPLGLAGGINPYVYANNDPVNGSDPSGMDPGDVCQELMMYSSGSNVWFGWQDTHSTECLSGGESGSDSGFDPFAGDPSWTPNGLGVGGDDPRVEGGTSTGKPTLQQVVSAVGKTVAPFNNAMNHGMDCAERSTELAVSSTGDWSLLKALKKVFSIQTITELVTRTLSMGETKVTVSTVSTESAIVVNSAAAKQAGRIYAVGAVQTRGFNWIHGDNPLLSYVPVVGDFLYGLPAAARACTAGASE